MTTTTIPVAAFRYTADGRQVIAETANVRGAVEGLNRTTLGNLDLSFKGLASTVGRFVPVFSALQLGSFALSAVRAADAMGDAAERADMSVESFSRLQYVAQQSDIEFGELTNSLKQYQTRLGDAARGGGPLLETLGRLNLSARELSQLDTDKQLALIADRFSTMVPSIDRARVATDLFGKSGTTLIPLLNKGSDGVKELSEEADRLGITLNSRSVAAIDRSTKALQTFGAALKSIIADSVGYTVASIFGSGNELLDLESKYKSLTEQLRQYQYQAEKFPLSNPGAAERVERLKAQIDALEPRLQVLRDLDDLTSGRGSRSHGPTSRRADPVQEVSITARRIEEEDEYDAILNGIQEERSKKQQEWNDALIAQQSEVRAATIASQEEISEAIGRTSQQQMEQSMEASRRQRERQLSEEENFQGALTGIRAAGYAAAVSLQTAYGGKYAAFAKGILIIEKAIAVKSIFMETQIAMMKAIKLYGVPWGYAVAAGIAVYGAARVAAIASNVVGGDNGPALGSPHNPVATTPASPDEPGSTQDTGGGRVVQLVVNGNVYSGRETVDFFVQQLQDRINEYDTVIINPKSRQATELLEARQ